MDLLTALEKEEIREFFSKNWMTHDAMWYAACVRELGPEKANRLNKAAVRQMAGLEVRRVSSLMGRPARAKLSEFRDLKEVVETTFGLLKAGFMKFEYSFPEKNLMRFRFDECFAHDGVGRFGRIESYDCGIVERIKGWLEGLGVGYNLTPDFSGCLMHQTGACEIEFHFELD